MTSFPALGTRLRLRDGHRVVEDRDDFRRQQLLDHPFYDPHDGSVGIGRAFGLTGRSGKWNREERESEDSGESAGLGLT